MIQVNLHLDRTNYNRTYMHEKRSIKEIKWWFSELCHEEDVIRYLNIFPELDSNLSKYAIGVLLWEIKGMVIFCIHYSLLPLMK